MFSCHVKVTGEEVVIRDVCHQEYTPGVICLMVRMDGQMDVLLGDSLSRAMLLF